MIFLFYFWRKGDFFFLGCSDGSGVVDDKWFLFIYLFYLFIYNFFSKKGFSRCCSDGVPHLYCCPSSSVLVETGSGQATRKKKTGRLLTLFMAWYGTALHSIGTCQPILLLESASPSSTCSILECGKYFRVSNYANSGVRIGEVGAAVPSWKSGKVCQGQ
jgi:hypothetical protein